MGVRADARVSARVCVSGRARCACERDRVRDRVRDCVRACVCACVGVIA